MQDSNVTGNLRFPSDPESRRLRLPARRPRLPLGKSAFPLALCCQRRFQVPDCPFSSSSRFSEAREDSEARQAGQLPVEWGEAWESIEPHRAFATAPRALRNLLLASAAVYLPGGLFEARSCSKPGLPRKAVKRGSLSALL